mgnify:CR=1 FL=1
MLKKLACAFALAVLAVGGFAVSPSVARAEEEVNPCSLTGCPGGAQLCAEVTGSVGVFQVKWYCYQAAT